jgi:hypothetical protein
MPRREETLPRDWQRNKDTPFEAQIVSIHTGTFIQYSVVSFMHVLSSMGQNDLTNYFQNSR